MTTAADSQVPPARPGESDRGGHVIRRADLGYDPRPPVDLAVPHALGADGVIVAVISGHDPADYAAALRRLADPRIRAAIGAANKEDVRWYSIESFGAGYAAVAESLAAAQ